MLPDSTAREISSIENSNFMNVVRIPESNPGDVSLPPLRPGISFKCHSERSEIATLPEISERSTKKRKKQRFQLP